MRMNYPRHFTQNLPTVVLRERIDAGQEYKEICCRWKRNYSRKKRTSFHSFNVGFGLYNRGILVTALGGANFSLLQSDQTGCGDNRASYPVGT